ncbi:prolipoprotein diacylglyceryl transferase family protein [Carboxylicivirga sp. M1479]|uniref:prolipoprotein diacylglyceryl transferase family protein n=1 Tax=Carboxylicivirga sp. M1479 TaxID=2594476 RepID=UPI00117741B6|nr:prolipoprotein diacylglyceryl transferase family protein [Carboxylicivirga sp. M1479]TRX71943.1 hypothetical protein FNN09_04800 [Carboxylicivirga sp. M1479]
MVNIKSVYKKIIYSAFFTIVLPVALFYWSKTIDTLSDWSVIYSVKWGVALFALGSIMLLWGMIAIMYFGKGLPLNAYPPETYVKKGPYYLLRHPIYWGFGSMLFGASIYFGSSGGFWLVSPILILSMTALVWGYERIQLKERFSDYDEPVFFSWPANNNQKPYWNHRLNAALLPLLLILITKMIFLTFDPIGDSTNTTNWIFKNIPEIVRIDYVAILLILLTPILPLTQKELRDWIKSVTLLNILVVYTTLVCLPFAEINLYNSVSFSWQNIFWADALSDTNRWLFNGCWLLLIGNTYAHAYPRWRYFIGLLSLLLLIIIVGSTKQPPVNLLTSLVLYGLIVKSKRIWNVLRSTSEKIANSWKEWEFGSIRIINHGFYVGAGAFLGVALSGWLVGVEYVWAIVIFGIIVIVFSALWAQFIEGSEKLKRPYGYYGALVGIIFSAWAMHLIGYQVWVVIGVISVFMPWIQAIGRLRCLINGCCHGSKVKTTDIGIRYFHPRSRVCGLSHMKGEALHPTPLYAIIWLFFVGFALLSMWFNNVSYSMIFGVYLLLSGIGRFVEEAYRGEVQTPFLYGLRLYQWTAMISMLIGAIITLIPVERELHAPVYTWDILYSAFTLGMFTFFAMGVDFPKSNKRFSRLV